MLNELTSEELFRHLVVFGSTGSGKTRHVILPLLADVLARDKDDPDKRAGLLVYDVKGDMATHLPAVMKSAGRSDEVIVLGRGGNAWIDPFDGIDRDSRAVAERVIEIVRGIHPQAAGAAYDDFWFEANRRFLQAAVVVARATEFGDLNGVDGLAHAIAHLCAARPRDEDESSPGTLAEEIASAAESGWISKADAEMALIYISGDLANLSSTTWSVIASYAQSYVSCLRDSKIAAILRPSTGDRFTPENVIDHGRVVLVSLSRVHYGPAAEVYRTLVKTAFQQCALQRFSRSYFDGHSERPINATRPVFLVADEFPAIVTVGTADDGDAFFLDKAREVKVGCILSAQGLSALSSRMPYGGRAAHLLNNCCSKIFLATDCPETLHYFRAITTGNEPEATMRTVGKPVGFRLPNYQFEASRSDSSESSNLRRLDVGEGILVRPRGVVEHLYFPAFSRA